MNDNEMHPVAGNVDARYGIDNLRDLRNHHAVLECSSFNYGRRVLGIRPRVEIALAVGTDSHDQRNLWREVNEVAGEQFQVGVYGTTQFALSAKHQLGDALSLRRRISIVQALGDAALEYVQVLGNHDSGLHHVQIMNFAVVDRRQGGRQQIRLLLVVTLEANTVAGTKNCLQQCCGIVCRYEFTACITRPGLQPRVARNACAIPISH